MEIDGMEADNSAAANNGTAAGASSTHASTEGQEMDTSAGYDYEVFLSFRGPDSRATFTDFLWTLLEVEGIRTFKDDESLRVGEEFEPKLLKAINESKISIPIFTKGYASSVWCLKELAQMVKCRKEKTQLIKPIFYDVAPSEVRNQTGDYAKAFETHEQKGRDETTRTEWKNALREVGKLSGWDLHSEGKNRREGAFAKRVALEVFNDLKKANLVVPDCFVDVNDDMRKIKDMIAVETSETRIIGIHGMGGIGKTTIAKKIYNELSNKFEHRCFLSNIREMSERRGIEYLQHQLVCTVLKTDLPDLKNKDAGIEIIRNRLPPKKVLLFLDDVDHKEHMNALVGKRNWFGTGSKLIITTRNKEVLEVPEVDDFHEVNGMNYVESLRLFCKHAFGRDSPLDEYINQSNKAIDIAGGLPLALEIIGSLLGNTEKKMWDATLKMLESVPRDKVQSKLKISYEALDFRQKRIFLDIACLFIGYNIDILIHYWDESIFFPKEAMKVLQNLSLIKIGENNEVWMHDQLRDLGREMVREKSDTKIEKQSRVWNPREGFNLLRRHKGKKKVEALFLELDGQQQYRFTYESFENLSDLRFLQVDGLMENFHGEDRLLWHESALDFLATNENSYLLPHLRWLSWRDIPPTFNITNLSIENVVILNLSGSGITDDWKGWSPMKVMKNLKVLDLSNCGNLQRLPDELGLDLPSLERLHLRNCGLKRLSNTIGNLESLIELDISHTTEIKELPDSIGKLKNLKVLNLTHCWNLRRLPDELGRDLASLERLYLRNCGLKRLPNTIGNLESLVELNISHTMIKKLPDSIGKLKNLKVLDLTNCWNLQRLPDMLGRDLASLERLYLRNCGLKRLPNTIGNLESLVELDISYTTGIEELPDSIGKLKNLKVAKMEDSGISNIHDAFWMMEKLEQIEVSRRPGAWAFHLKIDDRIYSNKSLRILRLKAKKIYAPTMLPESLTVLHLDELPMDKCLEFSNLTNLKELRLRFGPPDKDDWKCNELGKVPIPPLWIRGLTKLEDLSLVWSTTHTGLSLYRTLGSCCSPTLLSICFKNLSSPFIDLIAITEIQGLVCLENLQDLVLKGLPKLERLPDLSNLNKLRSLVVNGWVNLFEFTGELSQSLKSPSPSPASSSISPPDLSLSPRLLRLPSSLSSLVLEDCWSLCSIGDLSSLKNLSSLRIKEVAITEIQDLVCLENLRDLYLYKLPQLKRLPDLINLSKLRNLTVYFCDNLVEFIGELPQSMESPSPSPVDSSISPLDLGQSLRLPRLPSSLSSLVLEGCQLLHSIGDLSSLKNLSSLHIKEVAITEIQGLVCLENLQDLYLDNLPQLKRLPDLRNLSKLKNLRVFFCNKLVEIQGELPRSLDRLHIYCCKSLEKVPDLSSLMGQGNFLIDYCEKLNGGRTIW